MSFEMRHKKLWVNSSLVFECSGWDEEPVDELSEEEIIVQAVVLSVRQRDSRKLEPYFYIDEDPQSARGIWANEADYVVID